jgi:serine/threonine protein kinase
MTIYKIVSTADISGASAGSQRDHDIKGGLFLDQLCQLDSIEAIQGYTQAHLSPAPTLKEKFLRKLGIHHLRFPTEESMEDIVIKSTTAKNAARGAFGSISFATGGRSPKTARRDVTKTPSTSDMAIKKEHPEDDRDLVLILREYLLGQYISHHFSDLAKSPCAKTLALEITPEKRPDHFKTKIVQTKVQGKSLGSLIFGGPNINLQSLFHRSFSVHQSQYTILYALFSQLTKLHGLQVLHNDLNPYNVMVDLEPICSHKEHLEDKVDCVKLVDLGRVIFVGNHEGKSDPFANKLSGIKYYLSPHQNHNCLDADKIKIEIYDELVSFGLFMIHFLSAEMTRYSSEDHSKRNEETLKAEVLHICRTDHSIKDNAELVALLTKLFDPSADHRDTSKEILDFLRGMAAKENDNAKIREQESVA